MRLWVGWGRRGAGFGAAGAVQSILDCTTEWEGPWLSDPGPALMRDGLRRTVRPSGRSACTTACVLQWTVLQSRLLRLTVVSAPVPRCRPVLARGVRDAGSVANGVPDDGRSTDGEPGGGGIPRHAPGVGSVAAEPAPPPSFLCPISMELMGDPVMLASGHTYDRASIEHWLSQGHGTCPVTGARLRHLELTPNYALRSAIMVGCVCVCVWCWLFGLLVGCVAQGAVCVSGFGKGNARRRREENEEGERRRSVVCGPGGVVAVLRACVLHQRQSTQPLRHKIHALRDALCRTGLSLTA